MKYAGNDARTRRSLTGASPAACSLAALLAACLVMYQAGSGVASAQSLETTFKIDDIDPESAVPTPQEAMKAPLQMGYWTMLITERADAAEQKGDLRAAAKYFRALAKAVPDRRIAFSRLCRLHGKMGDHERAVEYCKATLAKAGVTLEDAVRFVKLVLSKEGALQPGEIADLDAVFQHMKDEVGKPAAQEGDPQPSPEDIKAQLTVLAQLECEVGVRLQSSKRLEKCTAALARLAPKDPRTYAFSWALAVQLHDYDRAETVIAQAQQANLPKEAIARMQARLVVERDRASLLGRLRREPTWVAGAGLLLLTVGSALIFLRRPPKLNAA